MRILAPLLFCSSSSSLLFLGHNTAAAFQIILPTSKSLVVLYPTTIPVTVLTNIDHNPSLQYNVLLVKRKREELLLCNLMIKDDDDEDKKKTALKDGYMGSKKLYLISSTILMTMTGNYHRTAAAAGLIVANSWSLSYHVWCYGA
jgi:hypothetical protein